MELCEPLTFKGREGSGHPGGRNAYADPSLAPASLDSTKFTLTYMLWGRYLYNPDTAPDFYHRYLKQAFGPAGPALESALAASSRILPLVTTAWCPSASNHEFWPEMLTPVSILPYTGRSLYTDSPAPHNVSAISPLDPQLFTTIDQHAKDLVSGTKNARYNSSEVIQWLDAMVKTAATSLASTQGGTTELRLSKDPAFNRAWHDILILDGLGSYYSHVFRAALFYSIAQQTNDSQAAALSIAEMREARNAWAATSGRAAYAYTPDISYGSTPFRRGRWDDRLPAIDADVAALEKHFAELSKQNTSSSEAVQRALHPLPRPTIAAHHTAPESFHPGSELALTIATPPTVTDAILWYRHVNHGERWLSTPMQQSGATHTAAIPAAYTDSPYPLQYYFELRTTTSAALHPAFNPTLSNQPYYAVHVRA
jgi:hypothetical protein